MKDFVIIGFNTALGVVKLYTIKLSLELHKVEVVMAYLKQEFTDYLYKKGYGNPGAYCNGLDNVEKLFNVDIESEYAKDMCVSLYNTIQETRKKPEIIGKNEHDVRTYASRLNIYTKFKQAKVRDDDNFTWIPFYEEFATKLLDYKDRRTELLSLLKECFESLPFEYPFREQGKIDFDDIDPFTIFGSFNKGMKDDNRRAIIRRYKETFNVKADIPKDFNGIPVMFALSAWFFAYKDNRGEKDIDNLWTLFETAISYADGDDSKEEEFIEIYNIVTKQKQAKWNITIGLFWIRPASFLSLDSVSREYLPNFEPPVGGAIASKELPDGRGYIWNIKELKRLFVDNKEKIDTFYELSDAAYKNAALKKEVKVEDRLTWWPSKEDYNLELSKDDWKKFILEIELPEHPQPMQMLKGMIELGGEASCKKLASVYGGSPNSYVGRTMNLGRRVKNYFNLPACMDGDQERYFPFPFLGRKGGDGEYIYKIRPELLAALQEIDLSEINPMYDGEDEENKHPDTSPKITPYTKEDFLKQVYMTEDKYTTCVSRLEHRKNLILQGAPGVGKTFAAQRLAWSMMKIKDDSRVKVVQFHQNYSYEDFVMGYKPSGNGFVLEEGIFYKFCKEAEEHPFDKYFFIIDEINRGNMSKIFGELLMLIEKDYRGQEIVLAYNKEPFSVPKNLYIIGMMNTADRSLAMIDYALRRRFSFVEMEPGFDSEGFKNYQETVNNDKFAKLIGRINALNADIENDSALGKGFCIGHSYFCNLPEDCNDELLKEIVKYDIVPMLEEYWFDDIEKAQTWDRDLSGVFNG